MHAVLIWVIVSLVHPSPYAIGYAYPTLTTCQHAMNVFALPNQQWACRSIEVLPEPAAAPTSKSSAAVLDRGRRNAAYDEARLQALLAGSALQPR